MNISHKTTGENGQNAIRNLGLGNLGGPRRPTYSLWVRWITASWSTMCCLRCQTPGFRSQPIIGNCGRFPSSYPFTL